MKKKILCFGANSFLANAFISQYDKTYDLIKVKRKGGDLAFDFDNDSELVPFIKSIPEKISGIIFFQGMNPSVGLKDMTVDHFQSMIKLNLSVPTVLIRHLISKMEKDCSVVFFSSVALKKGSYDPSYASAKSALSGLIQSLANACPEFRFNALALGLVEGSPVHQQMSADFVERHKSRMYDRRLINPNDVASMISQLIDNVSLNRQEIFLDGGYQ